MAYQYNCEIGDPIGDDGAYVVRDGQVYDRGCGPVGDPAETFNAANDIGLQHNNDHQDHGGHVEGNGPYQYECDQGGEAQGIVMRDGRPFHAGCGPVGDPAETFNAANDIGLQHNGDHPDHGGSVSQT